MFDILFIALLWAGFCALPSVLILYYRDTIPPCANGGRLGLHPEHALAWLASNALRRIERLGVIGGYGQRLNQMQIFTRFWPFIPC